MFFVVPPSFPSTSAGHSLIQIGLYGEIGRIRLRLVVVATSVHVIIPNKRRLGLY